MLFASSSAGHHDCVKSPLSLYSVLNVPELITQIRCYYYKGLPNYPVAEIVPGGSCKAGSHLPREQLSPHPDPPTGAQLYRLFQPRG
jgi:hypothetical protein